MLLYIMNRTILQTVLWNNKAIAVVYTYFSKYTVYYAVYV